MPWGVGVPGHPFTAPRGLERELLDEYGDELDEDDVHRRLKRAATEPAAISLDELADQADEAREAITAAEDILTRPSNTRTGWESVDQQ